MIRKLLLSVSLPALLLAHEYGPDPGYDGAPKQPPGVGLHPMACASAGCHSNDQSTNGPGGPINAFGGAVIAAFSSGSSYTPGGGPVTITVSVVDPVNTHFGFEMSARPESDLANGQAGNFTPGTNQIVICADGSVKFKGCPAGTPTQFIEHAYPQGFSVGTTPYSFTWTPPATNVGKVHFYVAGNAVNNDLKQDGKDHVYTAEYVLTPVLCSGATPVIGKVISAGGFGALPSFASGSWVEIYGSNFASDTWQWQGTDFNGANAPTKLAGLSVSINGNPAYMYFVTSGQVDVQAPAGATGPVSVTLTSCASTSAAFTATQDAFAPGLLAPPGFLQNGKQYVVAQFQDGSYVGDPKVIPGTSRPAKPGELLTIYGIGFGDVKTSGGDAVAPGVVVGQTNSLVNPLKFNFGSTPATNIQYAGLAPGNIGLYQINVTVPSVPDGDTAISATLNGVALPQTLFIAVHR